MTMTILTVVQVLIAIAMIAIILVQRGPGASAGSGFGAGASATVFGARGSGSFLTRTTAILATSFFALSLLMAVIVSRTIDGPREVDLGVMGEATAPGEGAAPASDVPAIDELPVAPAPSGEGTAGVDDVPTADDAEAASPPEDGDGAP